MTIFIERVLDAVTLLFFIAVIARDIMNGGQVAQAGRAAYGWERRAR